MSNNPNILKLEENSRRFAVFEPSSSFADTKKECDFLHLWHTEFCSSFANCKAVLNFLLNNPIPKDWHPERSYPNPQIKKKIEVANLDPLPINVFQDQFHLWINLNYRCAAANKDLKIPNRNGSSVELKKSESITRRTHKLPNPRNIKTAATTNYVCQNSQSKPTTTP